MAHQFLGVLGMGGFPKFVVILLAGQSELVFKMLHQDSGRDGYDMLHGTVVRQRGENKGRTGRRKIADIINGEEGFQTQLIHCTVSYRLQTKVGGIVEMESFVHLVLSFSALSLSLSFLLFVGHG